MLNPIAHWTSGGPMRFLITVAAVFFVWSVRVATAQLNPCPANSFAANVDYSLNPNGLYCLVSNPRIRTPNNALARLADPTIVKIDGTYYVTGTSDDMAVGNFPIYRSSDLVNWSFHGNAFSGVNVGHEITINNRKFCDLWGPQLYRDPADGTNVWLSFTATEAPSGTNYCAPPSPHQSSDYQSIMVATVDRAAFVSGSFSFANAAMNRGHEPMWYGYTPDNNSPSWNNPLLFDGGAQVGHTIPVTGNASLAGPDCGDVYSVGGRFGHRCQGTNTWLGLDSFIFFDPAASNKRWMLYTWSVDEWYPPSDFGAWDGNHVAAYPMISNAQMDVTADGLHIPLAFRQNDTNKPTPTIENGRAWFYAPAPYCPDPNMMGDCRGVAEAPAAYRWNNRTYVTFSRNAWSGSAYGIFYRSIDGTLTTAALSSWGDASIDEKPLLVASNRAVVGGRSYGSGEIFTGPGGRPYLIFHAKANGSTIRYTYFKEL
ncbi:MAG: hypothetical protein DCC71_18130, partial [Proteobacteria bacterium]